MNLSEYLKKCGCNITEGHCGQVANQRKDLMLLTSGQNINVMEIGFNAGHSAETFLLNNPTLKLTSFDIGQHIYLTHGKQYIDEKFPGRHTLIIGDSTQTLPRFIQDNSDTKFDLLFIDGGHDYAVSKSDMINCLKLANTGSIIIMDDTTYTPGWAAAWTVGPTRVWVEAEADGSVQTIGKYDYEHGRGMSVGRKT